MSLPRPEPALAAGRARRGDVADARNRRAAESGRLTRLRHEIETFGCDERHGTAVAGGRWRVPPCDDGPFHHRREATLLARARLTLLGGFGAHRPDASPVELPTRKTEALL